MGCCLRNGLGLLIVAIFLLVMPLVITSTTVTQVTFSRETYTHALLRDPVLYDTLISDLLIEAVHDEDLGGEHVAPGSGVVLADVFGNLTEADWRQINDLIVPPDWLYTQLDHNVNAIFDWLETHEVPLPDLRLDMTPVRANLLGQPGREVANMLILSWEPCTPEEADRLEQFLQGEGEMVLCEPPGDMLASVSMAVTEPAMRTAATWMPKDFWLYEEVDSLSPAKQSEVLRDANTLRYNINVFTRLNLLWYLVPLALLALLVVATVRNAHAFFKWVGTALLAGGFTSLVLPLLMLLFGLGVLTDRVARPLERMAEGRRAAVLSDATAGVLNALLMAYVQPMLLLAGVTIVVGFVALTLAMGVFKSPPMAGLAPSSPADKRTPPPSPTEDGEL